jgi:hypothetical protein
MENSYKKNTKKRRKKKKSLRKCIFMVFLGFFFFFSARFDLRIIFQMHDFLKLLIRLLFEIDEVNSKFSMLKKIRKWKK